MLPFCFKKQLQGNSAFVWVTVCHSSGQSVYNSQCHSIGDGFSRVGFSTQNINVNDPDSCDTPGVQFHHLPPLPVVLFLKDQGISWWQLFARPLWSAPLLQQVKFWREKRWRKNQTVFFLVLAWFFLFWCVCVCGCVCVCVVFFCCGLNVT